MLPTCAADALCSFECCACCCTGPGSGQSRDSVLTELVISGQDAFGWCLHAAFCHEWSRCADRSAVMCFAACFLPHVPLSHWAVMLGCDSIVEDNHHVRARGHTDPQLVLVVPLEAAPEGLCPGCRLHFLVVAYLAKIAFGFAGGAWSSCFFTFRSLRVFCAV